MQPQIFIFAFMTFICAAISSAVSHTPSHCSAEHNSIHTTHLAPTVVRSGWHTTTVEESKRKVGVKRPATAVTAPTRYTTVSEDIDTTGILLPVHRVAESPGVGVLAGSAAPHSTVSGNGVVEPIETASMLLPVHRVAESPGVGFVSVEASMSAGTKQ